MRSKIKAFTLVELIISIVIVGLLAGVIFATYRTILDITVRVENEKIVANEMLFAHQVLQSLVDNYTIDFSKYDYIIPNNGLTGVLYLTGRGGDTSYSGSYIISSSDGAIILQKGSTDPIPLTDNELVTVSGLQFQIIPSNTTGGVTGTIPIGGLYFESVGDVYHPGFWLRGTMYIRRYKANTYIWSVKQSLQSFFNIRSY